MPLVTKGYTFSLGQTADPTQVNQDLDTLYTLVNGDLDSQNLAVGAVATANVANEAVTAAKTEGVAYSVDMLGNSCVFSGLTVTKDGSTASQVDVTAGVAYVKQSDGSLRRLNVAATNFRTTSASATYYLDLNPDGTWSFTTGHSSQANYLNVATVTSDASANVSTVTQNTTSQTITLLSSATGPVQLPNTKHFQSRISMFRGNLAGVTSTTDAVVDGGTSTGVYDFIFHASEWTNNTFYVEGLFQVSNSACTGYLGLWDSTASAAVAGSEITTTSTAYNLPLRSGSFTLTDGHKYVLYTKVSSASYSLTLIGADLLQLL